MMSLSASRQPLLLSPLPEGEVGPQGRVRVYALSGNAVNPHPPASPSTSPSGRGEDLGMRIINGLHP